MNQKLQFKHFTLITKQTKKSNKINNYLLKLIAVRITKTIIL